MSFFNIGECYKSCNETYPATDPSRLYCKKACDSDEKFEKCKNEYCPSLCIKSELGDDDKKGSWSRWLSRAPGTDTSEQCLDACFHGCSHKDEEDD